MNIKIAILDDNIIHIENSKRIIKECLKDEELTIYEYQYSEELIDSNINYDILLVDMELKLKDEGIHIIRKYQGQGKKGLVVFVTTHEEMVKDGYNVDTFRYVYKSDLERELAEALNSAVDKIKKNKLITVFIIGESRAYVHKNEIVYFETYNRNVKMHLINGEYIISNKISELYKDVGNEDFVMANKSCLINLKYVANLWKSQFEMKNGDSIMLSRKYKKEAEERFWSWKIRSNK